MIGLLAGWPAKIGAIVAGGLAALAAAAAAFAGVRRVGQQDQQAADLRKTVQNMETKDAVDRKVAAVPDADVERELREQWSRLQ